MSTSDGSAGAPDGTSSSEDASTGSPVCVAVPPEADAFPPEGETFHSANGTVPDQRSGAEPGAGASRLPAPRIPGAAWLARRSLAARRRLHHLVEVTLVLLFAIATACGMNWSTVRHLSNTLPTDPTWDPLYFAWQLAWMGHAVSTHPAGILTTPAFSHEQNNLAFTDIVWGYLPLNLVSGSGVTGAIRLYNLSVLASVVIAFLGAYLLARVLGARVPGALVAGAGFGFAPYRVQQIDHINVLSTGGAALALALLAWGNGWSIKDGWRPERIKPRWVLVGWLVALWQVSCGFAIGVMFGYVLGGAMVAWVVGWAVRSRRRLPTRLLVAHGVGGTLFLAGAAALARPLLWVADHHPEAARPASFLDLFSPQWQGLFAGGEWSPWYHHSQEHMRKNLGWINETLLLPGFVLIGLALIGLFWSTWRWTWRVILLAVVLGFAVLAMGTAFPGHGRYTLLPLWHHLPGWNSIRTPGRMIVWVGLALSLLAGGMVSRLTDFLVGRRGLWARWRPQLRSGWVPRIAFALAAVLLFVPTVAVTAEGKGDTERRVIAPAPFPNTLPDPVLVLPSAGMIDYQYQLWSVDGWYRLADGSSGFDTTAITAMRDQIKNFPDAASVATLRALGVRTVVVLRGWVVDTVWEHSAERPITGLGVIKDDRGEVVIYRL